ncbi:WSC domain-containing protein [Triangularia setosa]|uniref:WSC domain-containing protein n=1 Tax=Triangularia setosa TaxID=2587417 RepID=A0AAN7A989_9PEZI|nr:WSC domain-containing protein [Podospora setosa]
MQADRGCDIVGPPSGQSLALPAGGVFTGEIAENRAFTTLSYNGDLTTDWTDGRNHPEDWTGPSTGEGCLVNNPDGFGGPLHTQNQTRATGTALAISYNSDLANVNMENLVVISVAPNTPWKRLVNYPIPADLPPCALGQCYCAWLWVPHGCGEPNMYMQNFRCHVTGSTSVRRLGAAQPPVYCANNPSTCVKGPKQMIAWHQRTGNNVVTPGDVTPPYNSKMGFFPGAQNDIFESRVGCFIDSDTPRVLPHQITSVTGGMTRDKCIAACKAAGYFYAGVEYSTECFCGSAQPSSGLLVADSQCDMPCAGISGETCGAGWRIEVYGTGNYPPSSYTPAVPPRALTTSTWLYACQGVQWGGKCENLRIRHAEKCVSLVGTDFYKKIRSAGPDSGRCVLFR